MAAATPALAVWFLLSALRPRRRPNLDDRSSSTPPRSGTSRGTGKTLEDFLTDTCEPGSVIYTDGLKEYKGLPNLGYTHHPTAVSQTNDPAHVALPAVHRVASLFKRWLLGTHQGGVAEQHLDAYLDEFVFRFNRRKSRRRGALFYRLMCLAVSARPTTYDRIVWSRRGQASKLRGPKRGTQRQKTRAKTPRART